MHMRTIVDQTLLIFWSNFILLESLFPMNQRVNAVKFMHMYGVDEHTKDTPICMLYQN